MAFSESEQGKNTNIYYISYMCAWHLITPKKSVTLFPIYISFVQKWEKIQNSLLLKYWEIINHQLIIQRKVDRDPEKSLATDCNK